MANLPHANSRRMSSWWWDSHKNSRWLQENLTDMDANVKSMIKLIEEDADSFAKRAEMYYKKRPELVRMVEEFYRAYRALAERYDHATRVPSGLTENELKRFNNENDPQAPDDQYMEDKKGLNPFGERKFGGGRVRRGLNFDEAGEKEDTSNKNVVKLEKEIETLRDALAQYKQNSENMEEFSKKNKAEVESLKIALKVLEIEKETSFIQHQKCLERIEDMENIISRAEKNIFDLNEQAQIAEAEAQTLKLDLGTIESVKATYIDQCKRLLENISDLENRLVFSEDEAKMLNKRAEEANVEFCVEREANAVKYKKSLDTILALEKKISSAEEEVQMLNGKIESGIARLKGAEEKCILLEKSNQALYSELESLKLKMGIQSKEIAEKEREMGILWTSVQDERFRFVEAETAFQTLQILHAQTEEELKFLALELQKRSLKVSDLENRNQILLNESLKIKEENESLNELYLASLLSIKDMKNEIMILLETKEKLEEEMELRVDQRNALQQDIYCLKEELDDINQNYIAILDQIEAVGFKPESLQSAVKGVQDENLNLKETQEIEMREKLDLLGKLENLEKVVEKNTLLQKSVSDLFSDLGRAKEEIIALEKSFISVSEEKSTIYLEKAAILTQLQVATENLVKLSEKNTFLENSISDAHEEIKGMKIIFKSLEESCRVLENEKSDLINEQITLVSQVEITKGKLKAEVELRVNQRNALQQDIYCLKKEINDINKKYIAILGQVEVVGLNPESLQSAVKGLQDENLNLKETQEREMREKMDLLGKLENLANVVEENALLEKSVSDLFAELEGAKEEKLALEKSFISVSEEKSTIHLEKSAVVTQLQVATENLVKLSENNTFLENSVSEAHVELEGLKIMLKRLEESCRVLENEKSDLIKEKVSLVSQVEITSHQLEELEKKNRELENKYLVMEKEKVCAQGKVEELLSTVKESERKEEKQMIKIENLEGRVLDMQKTSFTLQEENLKLNNENTSLVKDLVNLQETNNILEGENLLILGETAYLSNLSLIFNNIINENFLENEELRSAVVKFEDNIGVLEDKLEKTRLENMELNKLLNKTEDKLSAITLVNGQLSFEIENGKDQLCQKKTEISVAKCKIQELEEKLLFLEKELESAQVEVEELLMTVKESEQKEEKQTIKIKNLEGRVLDMQKTSFTLQEENLKLNDENMSLVKDLVDLQETNNILEGENLLILGKAAYLSNLSLIFNNIINEKFLENEELRSTVVKLQGVSVEFEDNISVLEGKLEETRLENMDLNKLLNKTEDKLSVITLVNGQLSFEIENGKDQLCQKETEISVAKYKIRKLEEKILVLEKEKKFVLCEVEELRLTVKENEWKEKKQIIKIENLEGRFLDMQKTSSTLHEENLKLNDEKIYLEKYFVDLQEKNNTLEGEYILSLGEIAYLSNLSLIFNNIINEKFLENEELRSAVDKLQGISVGFEVEIGEMEGKLEEAQLENVDLNKLLKRTKDKLSAITLVNSQLSFEIEHGKDHLCQKETEISEAKCKVSDIEKEKLELQNIIACLKEKNDKIKMLWDEAICEKNKEISFLEIEATKLTSELYNYSAVTVLLEEKFHELAGVLKSLEEEFNSKDGGIIFLKERTSILEIENGEIGAQLAEYAPAINSLNDCISSLESRTCHYKQFQNGKHEELEVATENNVESHQDTNADQKETGNLLDLQNLVKRAKDIEKAVVETYGKLEAATELIEILGSKKAFNEDSITPFPISSESENTLLTKDIMLDQISESPSYAIGRKERIDVDIADLNRNEKITSPINKDIDFDSGVTSELELGMNKHGISNRFLRLNQEVDKTKILERLNSDSQKLTNLQTSVQELRKKTEMSEKNIESKSFRECERVEGQLVKAEENIIQLLDLNGKLQKIVDNSNDVKGVVEKGEEGNYRGKFPEQARKFSERIGQLQLEVQKIQFFMLKLYGENGEDKIKRKSEVSERKRRTSLSDYIGLRSSNRKKKRVFCVCVQPPSTEE